MTTKKDFERYINKWLSKNDFDYRCKLSDSFQADLINDTIFVALVSTDTADKYFKEYLYSLGLDYDCDIFLMSFFHELGHLETLCEISEKDFKKAITVDEELESKKKHTKQDYLKYFKTPVEKKASIWAVNYINDNPQVVKDFYDGLLPIIMDICRNDKHYTKYTF